MCRVEAGMKDWGGMLVVAEQESIKVIKKLKRDHMMLQTYACKLSFVRYVFFSSFTTILNSLLYIALLSTTCHNAREVSHQCRSPTIIPHYL